MGIPTTHAGSLPGRRRTWSGPSSGQRTKAPASRGYRGPVAMEAFASGDPESALDAFRKAFTI